MVPRDPTYVPSTSRPVKEGALAPAISDAASVLAQDVPHLIRESLELAKLEAKVAATRAAVRGGLLGLFGYLAAIGLFFVCVALSILVSQLTETPWAGPLVVGAFLVIAAMIGVPLVLKAGSKEEPQEKQGETKKKLGTQAYEGQLATS